MKMKEVLERTGLTDRAVRLYIANDLVAPECTRGYTGRNNYDFSEEDVEILQKIALLRKADFSLEQIKSLQAGGEEARTALASYLEEKREEYHRDGLILEALADLPGEEIPNLDELCNRLTEGFREKQVPKYDLKPTLRERMENLFFLAISGFFILIFVLGNLFVILSLRDEFIFPKFYEWQIIYPTWIAHLLLLAPIGLCLWVFIKHYNVRWVFETQELRKKSAILLVISLTITILALPLLIVLIGVFPVVYSETDDPNNYLIVSKMMDISTESMYRVFPVSIPYEAYEEFPNTYSENTEYLFRYRGNIKQDWDIYAEWQLPEGDFQREILRVRQNLQENHLFEQKIGEWICLTSGAEDLLDYSDRYCHLFFAYHPETNRVRYIYCFGSGSYSAPYFLTLDWDN